MKFSDLGLIEPLLKAVTRKGYTKPSLIQQKAIPIILRGRDVMASAQTGTGKTAAFVLPILQALSSRKAIPTGKVAGLVLTPTRELAAQIQACIEAYGQELNIKSAVVNGGVNINPQIRKLRKGIDLLVATPGRLLDLYQQGAIRFDNLDFFVLDEADRMLDMGFIHDLNKIQRLLPRNKQTLMFSATYSKEIRQLAATMLKAAAEVDVAPRNSTIDAVTQLLHPIDKQQKSRLLTFLIKNNSWSQVLVFTKTKHGADKLVRQLNKVSICTAAIHGNKSQFQRTKALRKFKDGQVDVLIATDIASRGLDIKNLPRVINFDLPHVAEDYVHRIGRTGRAGKSGTAISLVSADEIKQLRDIERLTGTSIERVTVESFEPEHQLPESSKIQGSKGLPSKKKQQTKNQKSKRQDQSRRSRNRSDRKKRGKLQTSAA